MAIKRAEAKIASDCAEFEKSFGKIVIIWNSFVDKEPILQYVQTINEIGEVPAKILMNSKHSFGDVGLLELASKSGNLAAALKKFGTIEITADADNATSAKVGKTRTLNPNCFLVTQGGNALNIRFNLKLRKNLPGVGRVVQFILCEQEALGAEENTRRAIAEDMRRHEEDSRRRETERANDRNEDIRKQNKRDKEDYDRSMQDYHKKSNERCNYSQCSGGKTKCGVCAGRGHNTNNKNVSTCSSCSGQGHRTCNQCDGTMKKYPNGPSLPNQPRDRSLDPMPHFGSLPDYYNQL